MATVVEGDQNGSLFNSYHTEVLGRALLLSLDCSTLRLICTLYCWVLRKEVSSTIFKVFGMTWPGIEFRSPEPFANTLPTDPYLLLRSVVPYSRPHLALLLFLGWKRAHCPFLWVCVSLTVLDCVTERYCCECLHI